MRAYIVETTQTIEPFGDFGRDGLIVNRSVASLQAEALRQHGCLPEGVTDSTLVRDDDEHLVVDDCLYFTPELLAEFVKRSRVLGGRAVLALKAGLTTTRSLVAAQGVHVEGDHVRYPLRYVPANPSAGVERPVVIDPDQFTHTVPVARHIFGEDVFRFPMTDWFAVRVAHWSSILAANLLSHSALGARLQKAPKMRTLALFWKARSFNLWKILQHVNTVGRGCDIHPTAYVEASTLGDNVTVCAGAIIRNTTIGTGAYIGNGAILEVATIGDGCNVMNGCIVQGSVLYPGTVTTARVISASVCGRDSFLADGTTMTDFRFDGQPVTVLAGGARVETSGLVGSCLGHGAYVGAGCILAPGRALPNGWRVTPEPLRVLSRWSADGEIPGYRVAKKGV